MDFVAHLCDLVASVGLHGRLSCRTIVRAVDKCVVGAIDVEYIEL